MTILRYATGDLRLIVNELDIDVLTHEDGGDIVRDHIEKSFSEYLDKQFPKSIERCLFASDGRRQKGESMLQYIARNRRS